VLLNLLLMLCMRRSLRKEWRGKLSEGGKDGGGGGAATNAVHA
jgi:hypothetical protein